MDTMNEVRYKIIEELVIAEEKLKDPVEGIRNSFRKGKNIHLYMCLPNKELIEKAKKYVTSDPEDNLNKVLQLIVKKPKLKYERAGILTLEETFPLILDNCSPLGKNTEGYYRIFFGKTVKMYSQRYSLFKNNSICVNCGMGGKFFAVEKVAVQDTKFFHLNLYAVKEDGSEVMMTKDHIIRKRDGGRNTLSNYQTLCINCNKDKN